MRFSKALFLIPKEHQITTGGAPVAAAEFTVSHSKRASNHNRKADAPACHDTVSHSKRASNHNAHPSSPAALDTVSHSKRASNHNPLCAFPVMRRLFLIPKEHQITTGRRTILFSRYCFSFQKSIKSQPLALSPLLLTTVSHSKRASNHNIMRRMVFPVSTVSHSKRASNHNTRKCWRLARPTVSHSKRASNHNVADAVPLRRRTVSHSKRASNHNSIAAKSKPVHCFSFQKSIKSQPI